MDYDVIILGGGPAGLAAATYAGRSRLKTVLVESNFSGGQIAITHMVENYPGFPEGISGPELSSKLEEQARKFGAEILMNQTVTAVELTGKVKKVHLGDQVITGKTVILATGASHRHLDCKGEHELSGKGVSYCATCDGAFFEELDIAMVGGGESALIEALYLTRFAEKVYLIHRRDQFRATAIVDERVRSNEKIELVLDSVVEEIEGDEMVEGVKVKNVKTGEIKELPVNGVFIAVGFIPNTELYKGQVDMNEQGYILAGDDCHTNLEGVFAAGDLRVKTLRQVVTAVSDGAVSAMEAENYIQNLA